MADSAHPQDNGSLVTAPAPESTVRPVPADTLANVAAVSEEAGGVYKPRPGTEGAVAFTHFDITSSEDHAITILLTKEYMNQLPSQTLVRINSLKDDHTVDRTYLATVVAGPFAEPDGFRTDSPLVVTTTVQGGIFLPRYHGRAYVQILGEESDGQVIPPRYRPRPNSPGVPAQRRGNGAGIESRRRCAPRAGRRPGRARGRHPDGEKIRAAATPRHHRHHRQRQIDHGGRSGAPTATGRGGNDRHRC